MKGWSILVIALGAIIAAGWINYRWAVTEIDISPLTSVSLARQPVAAVSASGAVRLELANGLDETLLRPIFFRDRRPFQPPPPEPVPAPVIAPSELPAIGPNSPMVPAAAAAKLTLLGVAVAGGRRTALIAVEGKPATAWYSEGETVADWTLRTIGSDQVILASLGRQTTLSLFPSNPTVGRR